MLVLDADNQDIKACQMRSGHWATTKATHEYVHRIVAERLLGRKLRGRELVHHSSEDKSDNRRINLVICPDDAYHQLLHSRARVYDAGGNPNTQGLCFACRKVKDHEYFAKTPRTWNGRAGECKECSNARRREAKYNYWGPAMMEKQRQRRAAKRAQA